MRSAGIDIGSRSIKLVVVDGREVVARAVADTTWDPLGVCRRLLADHPAGRLTATGYGRHLFREHWPEAEAMTEIRAVALGAARAAPGCHSLIDIGGQDTKVVALDRSGRMAKFVMNDRCAAGTGQFLEMMATALAYTRNEFVAAAGTASRAETLSSICSVIAQSEVVSLIARGARKEEIALGVHQSIARRTAALAGGIVLDPPVLFTGGGALNPVLVRLVGEATGRELLVPDHPQTVAALGCALHGAEKRTETEPTDADRPV